MDELVKIASLVAAGFFLMITPIPLFPMMFISQFKKLRHENEPISIIAVFLLFNSIPALIPILLIGSAFVYSPIGGILFAIIMYYPALSSGKD